MLLLLSLGLFKGDEIRVINSLNADLNPICHLLVLLGDLTFMGPCILSIFQYISNKMQRHAVYLYLETSLHVSGDTSTHLTAICHYRGRVGTGLSVLWVAYASCWVFYVNHTMMHESTNIKREEEVTLSV
jgi:hypothetical protein